MKLKSLFIKSLPNSDKKNKSYESFVFFDLVSTLTNRKSFVATDMKREVIKTQLSRHVI